MTLLTVPWIAVQGMVNKLMGLMMSLLSVWFYLQRSMDLLVCVMMVISSFMVYDSLDGISSFSSLLRTVDLSVELVQEVLDLKPMDISGKEIIPNTANLHLEHVHFSYGNRQIINDISLNIPEKTTTAIVGPSGSGKTTLCNLMARFWDIDSGKISLDNVNVKDYSYDSLIKNFSFVFQNVYLFEDTIENNIKFGKTNASHEEVVTAAKKACCHGFTGWIPN